jgi:hypothetical protein
MRKIPALIMLFLLVGSSFIVFLPPISGQLPVSSGEGFTIVDDFIAGVSDTQWQKDTQFTSDAKISVNGGDMVLDFDHTSWQWNTITYANGTWVIHETRNVWGFGVIQYACNNNIEGVIKCWLRGEVSIPTDYRIGVSPGIWNSETNIYKSHNQKYQFNLTDIAEYGFPIAYDTDTSQLVIGVSGTFDIDPTITELGSNTDRRGNDVTVTVGHWDYIFYKSLDDWVQYQYRNSSDATSRWHNGSKIWAVNRTEYTERPNGFAFTNVGPYFPHAWKTNGTHIYGAIASKATSGKDFAARFLLFNVTQLNDAHNVTGYDVGSLVLHTNATIPCLGVAETSASCRIWNDEMSADASNCGERCFIDVNMNSSGFPMVIYSTDQQVGGAGGDCPGAGHVPCTAPAIVIAIAENPIGAMCRERLVHTERACNANDARNGKNGTWTQPYQVDTQAERLPGGSGHRYLWYTTGTAGQYQWEGNVCGMGNGNMLMVWHNRTAANSNQGNIYGRFWYQANATWGTEFPIWNHGTGTPGAGSTLYWMHQYDNMDLACTPDASGTMTAHVAWSIYYSIGWSSDTSHSGSILYQNFTSASTVDTNNPFNDVGGNIIIRQWEQFIETYAKDVQVAADNSTGTIGVFYYSNRGDSFYNFTGYYGTAGFGKTQALQTQSVCGYTGASPAAGPPERSSMTAAMFMNGTATDNSLSSFWTFGCGSSVQYTHWLNSSITATLSFYHSDGTLVQVQNMTFTSQINGTQLGVFNCAVCTAGLAAGTYQVDGIFLNDIDMEYNGTDISPTFYIDLANTTASFIVGNMTVTFVFKDETTLQDWDVTTKPVKVDMWTLSNRPINETTINSDGDLSQFVSFTPGRIKVSFGDSYEFYRWDVEPNGCLTSGCDTTVTFYLPDYSKYDVEAYTWNFADQTQQYSNGTILFRKYVSTGLIQIDHSELSIPTNQIIFYAIVNQEYTITAFSLRGAGAEPLERSDIGLWTAGTVKTVTANIQASALFASIPLSQNYVFFDARRTICSAEDIANTQNSYCSRIDSCVDHSICGPNSNVTIYFKDIKNETSTVTFEIFNKTGLQYSTTLTGNPGQTIMLWQGADTNTSHLYWIKMTAASARFGAITETKPIGMPSTTGPLIAIGRCTAIACDGNLLPNYSPYYIYISMMILIFTVGMFSQATAAIGGIITAVIADLLYMFGWLPGMSPMILALITLFSFFYLFAVARGR